MKVLHINCNYIGTALHRVMFRHVNAGGGHKVFVPSDGRKEWQGFVPAADETVSECFRPYDRYIFFKKQAQIRRSVEKSFDVKGFDCLHAYTLFTDGNCAMTLSKKYNIPYVAAVRNTDLNGFFKRRWLLRRRGIRILENASAVFFLSETYRRQLLERYVPRDKWDGILQKSHIIPNGVDPFWLENPAPPKGEETMARLRRREVRVIVAARIDRYKNQVRTAEAVEELIRRGYEVRFTAVGRVLEDSVLERLRQCPGFVYIPPQPKEKLLELYRENDLFVMPSTDETFGLVYPEAMSQRLPVIYSVGEGFYGQFPEGEAGYAADPRSTQDVVDKILLALEHYEEISARAPELARRFDWRDITAQYQEIYRHVTSADRSCAGREAGA